MGSRCRFRCLACLCVSRYAVLAFLVHVHNGRDRFVSPFIFRHIYVGHIRTLHERNQWKFFLCECGVYSEHWWEHVCHDLKTNISADMVYIYRWSAQHRFSRSKIVKTKWSEVKFSSSWSFVESKSGSSSCSRAIFRVEEKSVSHFRFHLQSCGVE